MGIQPLNSVKELLWLFTWLLCMSPCMRVYMSCECLRVCVFMCLHAGTQVFFYLCLLCFWDNFPLSLTHIATPLMSFWKLSLHFSCRVKFLCVFPQDEVLPEVDDILKACVSWTCLVILCVTRYYKPCARGSQRLWQRQMIPVGTLL